jgi:ABC-2 type transport system ATP-binding protein
MVRATADEPVPPGWEAHPVGLEELALAYLREPTAAALPGPDRARWRALRSEPGQRTEAAK